MSMEPEEKSFLQFSAMLVDQSGAQEKYRVHMTFMQIRKRGLYCIMSYPPQEDLTPGSGNSKEFRVFRSITQCVQSTMGRIQIFSSDPRATSIETEATISVYN